MCKGVSDLMAALGQFKAEWPNIDTVAVTVKATDGHMLTLRLSGSDLTSIERDDGVVVIVRGEK